MLWKRGILLTSLLCFTFSFSQTQLKEGDIAIIGIDCIAEDFMFVTFVPLQEGTQIYFTDEEANGSYQIGLGEGTVLYTAPIGGVPRGTVISYVLNASEFTTTFDGALMLANTGDGVIAYQGDAVGAVNVFLDAVGKDGSVLGTFPNGFTGLVLGTSNGQYQGLRAGKNQVFYNVLISDSNEWEQSEFGVLPFNTSPFTFDNTPYVYASKSELSGLGYNFDEDSKEGVFYVEGYHLAEHITLNVSDDFEISLVQGNGFGNEISLVPNFGAIQTTSIYVRLKEGLNFDSFNGVITISTLGLSNLEITLEGASKMGFKNYCSDLFISEYVEGSSNNKYIEIFNPTISEIELSDAYQLEIYNNGAVVPSSTIDLIGVIASNGVFVIEHPSEALNVFANQQSGGLNFNGNDALVLRANGNVIDVVGKVGIDPDEEWQGVSCFSGTKDGGLIRKSSVMNGIHSISEDFDVASWMCTSLNDVSDLGVHTNDNPSKLSVWNGVNWTNGIPDENDVALINEDYISIVHGEINSCMLYVSENAIVEIGALNPVVVKRDVAVKGAMLVHTFGSLVQINDASTFTIVDNGIAQVSKRTSILNQWYEYTYWSSPVTAIDIDNALSISPANRRYYFKAENFVDLFAEVDNSGVFNSGSDNIDDDGNDWQRATGIMKPGVGYAATVSSEGFIPGAYNVNFTGVFNNGEIVVPVIANSDGNYKDWNFIGNPYPGGLDVAAFLNENKELLSGALYLWSHNSPPSSSNSGNSGQNFSNSDYAIITGSGVNSAGGDGVIPESFVPSGQGFFVEAMKSGDVVFNNLMRSHHSLSNSQFFKNSVQKKETSDPVVWLNMTSEKGVFSQIAIGFFNNATDENDGEFYDVQTKYSASKAAMIFSKISNSNESFVIQGRSLDGFTSKKIGLEIVSNITSETEFKIEIAKMKGVFLEGYPIYVFDKRSEELHDLTQGSFQFSMGKGVESDRFELWFSKEKSAAEVFLDSNSANVLVRKDALGKIQFVAGSEDQIKNVEIYDLLGRRIYHYKNVSSEDWLDISKVQIGVYVSRIQMESGKYLSKKAIKMN